MEELKGEVKLLRIYISNTDKFKHNLIYEVLVYTTTPKSFFV